MNWVIFHLDFLDWTPVATPCPSTVPKVLVYSIGCACAEWLPLTRCAPKALADGRTSVGDCHCGEERGSVVGTQGGNMVLRCEMLRELKKGLLDSFNVGLPLTPSIQSWQSPVCAMVGRTWVTDLSVSSKMVDHPVKSCSSPWLL